MARALRWAAPVHDHREDDLDGAGEGQGKQRPPRYAQETGGSPVIDCRSNRPVVSDDLWRKRLNATFNASYGLAKGYVDFFSFGTTMAAQAAVDLRIRRRRLEALERFLHFVNAVEVFADEASGRATSVVLRLEAEKAPIYKGGRIRISGQYDERWYLKEIPFDCARLARGVGGSSGPGLRPWW